MRSLKWEFNNIVLLYYHVTQCRNYVQISHFPPCLVSNEIEFYSKFNPGEVVKKSYYTNILQFC